ncbi:MAG: hemerythrin domain-containing protein [Acidobacteriaceae bacterium]
MSGTEHLQKDQRTIERVTRACRVFAEMLQNGTSVPAGVLQSVVKFLRVFCHDYYGEQEDWLFAMLQTKGFPFEGFPIESLRHEHDRLALLTNQLGNSVDVYSLNHEDMAKTRLISTLRALAELYSDHVWKENYVLLPIAEELFSAADQRVLADKLQMVEVAMGADARLVVEQLRDNIRQCPECNQQESHAA